MKRITLGITAFSMLALFTVPAQASDLSKLLHGLFGYGHQTNGYSGYGYGRQRLSFYLASV